MGRVAVMDMYIQTTIGTFFATLALLEFCVAKDAVDNGNLKFAEVFFNHLPTLRVSPAPPPRSPAPGGRPTRARPVAGPSSATSRRRSCP